MEMIFTEKELLDFVKGKYKIYVYGTGFVSKLLSKRLYRYNVDICCYIETEPHFDVLNNIPIKAIDTVQQEHDICIIVATRTVFHQEILRNLEGFENVFVLSEKLISYMQVVDKLKLQFQTHIVEHCNLNCRGCYHFSPLANKEFLSIDDYKRDIKRLSELFNGNMERILLLGGEPLLHPQVNDFFVITRKYFPHGDIHMLTNGTLLLQMGGDFYHTIRDCGAELWVTKYPINFDYTKAEKYAEGYGVKLKYFSNEPVRTLGHQPLDIDGKQDSLSNFNNCYRADECVDLKHGKIYPCIIPAEIRAFNEYYKCEIPVTDEDFVDIYKVNSAAELLEKLGRPIPFCRFCNRDDISVFGSIPWEKTNYKMEEWTK